MSLERYEASYRSGGSEESRVGPINGLIAMLESPELTIHLIPLFLDFFWDTRNYPSHCCERGIYTNNLKCPTTWHAEVPHFDDDTEIVSHHHMFIKIKRPAPKDSRSDDTCLACQCGDTL